MKDTTKGASIFDLVLAVGFIAAVVLSLQVLFSKEQSQERDFERLRTMRRAEQMFSDLYLATGSYELAAENGCGEEGALLSQCNFNRVGLSASTLRDPGKTPYTVTAVPSDETYGIHFTLENPHGDFAAGEHTVSPAGIQ